VKGIAGVFTGGVGLRRMAEEVGQQRWWRGVEGESGAARRCTVAPAGHGGWRQADGAR
jgi:hypothetical protein